MRLARRERHVLADQLDADVIGLRRLRERGRRAPQRAEAARICRERERIECDRIFVIDDIAVRFCANGSRTRS